MLKAGLMVFADSFQIDGDSDRCFQELKLSRMATKTNKALY